MENGPLNNDIIEACKKLQPELVEIRRHLHQNPETMYAETKTRKFLKQRLEAMGYTVQKTAGTGLVCSLTGGSSGKTVAIRADMDALNLQEENDVPYRSLKKGKMHACGHDAHMACLLGAAKVLRQFRERIRGTVKFIFQPAEEGGAGAKLVVEEGQLEGVDVIFGMHVWGDFPSGEIYTRKGAMMASALIFRIEITGKGGHAAVPHKAADPTNVIVEIYDALQKLVTREVDPIETVVLTTPQPVGSNAPNIIPNEASLTGTLRTFNLKTKDYLVKRIEEIAGKYSEAWHCQSRFTLLEVDYPPVINDDTMVDKAGRVLAPLGGIHEMDPTMGGEDFAFYLQKVRGAFVFLGVKNEAKGIVFPNHHPKFDIDEDVLWKGASILALLGVN